MSALHNSDRLNALRYLDLLEPVVEESFERLARLAAHALNLPMAYISFVGHDRQVLRGAYGLPTAIAAQRETPLSQSFCQFVIADEQQLIVEDVREIPELHNIHLVSGLGIVAYMGIPIRMNDGLVLGSFCAADTAPRQWSEAEIATLQDFAALATAEIEARVSAREAEQARHEWLALLESSGAAVFGLDRDANCTYINEVGQQFFGYSASECLGKNMHDLVHAYYPDGSRYPFEQSLLYQVLHTGATVHLQEKTFWHKDGHALPALCSSSPVMQYGLIAGAVVTVVDIRDQKQAETWQQIFAEVGATITVSLDYQQILAGLGHLLVPQLADWCTVDLVDEGGNLNRVAAAHVDPAKEPLLTEIIGQYPLGQAENSPLLQVLQSGRSLLRPELSEADLQALAHDAEHLRLIRELGLDSGMILPLEARGRVLGLLSLVRIKPHRYEAIDLPMIMELTRRCAMALDNARLYQQAQEAVLLRDQFVAIASHELRTPVTSIRGYAQLLERQADQGKLDQSRTKYHASQIVTQATRLAALISDLLDASRFQQGRLDLDQEPCDLAKLADATLLAFRTAPDQPVRHQFRLIAPEPVVGRWDAARLDQVLTNLISNAIKYSPNGGEVAVEVTNTADGHGQLQVRDQGLGIATEDQIMLFQPFARVASPYRQIGGTGLGLYIVRQIVEGHGGRITVESRLGEGSTFTILLPQQRLVDET